MTKKGPSKKKLGNTIPSNNYFPQVIKATIPRLPSTMVPPNHLTTLSSKNGASMSMTIVRTPPDADLPGWETPERGTATTNKSVKDMRFRHRKVSQRKPHERKNNERLLFNATANKAPCSAVHQVTDGEHSNANANPKQHRRRTNTRF